MQQMIIKQGSELNASDKQSMRTLLDACDFASAYQHPDGDDDALYFLLVQDGQLRFYGRGSMVPLLGRRFPWFKRLAFNRGPVAATLADLAAGLVEVKHWARQQRVAELGFLPDITPEEGAVLAAKIGGSKGFRIDPAKRFTLRLAITPSEDELLARLPGDCRYRIKRSLQAGITLRYGQTLEDVDALVGLHRDMTTIKGLPENSGEYLHGLWRLREQEPGRLALVIAEYQGDVLGANLVFRTGRRAEYLLGAVARGKAVVRGNVSAGYVLQWGGIQWAKAQGCIEYDFGGYDPSLTGGPAQLKRAFFPVVEPVPLCSAVTVGLLPIIPAVALWLKRLIKINRRQ